MKVRAPNLKRLKLKRLSFRIRSRVVSVARVTSSEKFRKLRVVSVPLIRISKPRRNALAKETK